MKNHYYISALVLIRGDIRGAVSRTFLWDETGKSLEEFRRAWETELAKDAIQSGSDLYEEEIELSIAAVIPCPGDDMRGMPRSR